MYTQQPQSPTLRNLFSVALAFLMLVTGCASPPGELTATSPPPSATATAAPTATATATPAPTATPASVPVVREIITATVTTNLMAALAAKYLLASAELKELNLGAPDTNQYFLLSKGKITDRDSLALYQTDSVVIINPAGEALVFKNNIDFNKVTNPGRGYAVSFAQNREGNFVHNINRDALTLEATSADNSSTLVWNPETEAWEEKAEEHETAFEAIENATYEVLKVDNITVRATQSWEERTDIGGFVPDLLTAQEGLEPSDIIRTMVDTILPMIEKNGIGALDIINRQPVVVKANSAEEFAKIKVKIVVDVGDKSTNIVDLEPNQQGIDFIALRGTMYGDLKGSLYTMLYDESTNTIIFFIKTHPVYYKRGTNSDQQSNFAANITTAFSFFGTRPEDIHYYLVHHTDEDSGQVNNPAAAEIRSALLEIADPDKRLWY